LNFYLAKGDQKIGPYSTNQIEIFLKQGLVTATDQVWAEGWPSWIPIGNVPGLAPAQAPEQATASMGTAHSQLEQVAHNLANGPIEQVRRTIPLNFCVLLGILLPLYSILSFTGTQAVISNLMLQGIANKVSTMDSSDIGDDAAERTNQNLSHAWQASWLGNFVLIPNNSDVHSAIQQKMADNLTYINLLFYVKIIFRAVIVITFLFLMMKSNFFCNMRYARWLRFPLAFPVTTLVILLLLGWDLILLLLQTSATADPNAAAIWNQTFDFVTCPLYFFILLSAVRYAGIEPAHKTAKAA